MHREHSRDLRGVVSQLVCFSLLFQTTGVAAALPLTPTKTLLTASELTARPNTDLPSSDRPGLGAELLEDAWGSLSEGSEAVESWWRGATSRAWSSESEEPYQIAQLGGPWPLPPRLMATLLSVPAGAQSAPPSPGSLEDVQQAPVSKSELAFLAEKVGTEEIPLLPGYNLISLPEQPADTDPAVVLAALGGQLHRVEAYDACDLADPWKLYDPADPAASDLTVIDHRKGLWVAPTVATVLPSDGTLQATTSLDLCVGWNLIGFPAGEARHPLTVLSSIAGKWERIFGYDAFDPADPWEGFDPAVPDWANNLPLMQPGRGYWLLVTEATTLTIRNQGPPPVVAISTPTDLSVVTEPTEIFGTVDSDRLASWTLSYRAIGEGEAVLLATGNAPVSGASFATFDPTLLLNGLYELELTATDVQGQQVTESIAVAVEGRRKIGNFTLSFVDLEIPLAGLDIKVLRTYDSRDKVPRAFGVGWTLEIFQGSYRSNRTPGEGWQILPGLLPCQTVQETQSHLTAIRLTEDEIYRFRLNLFSPTAVLGGCFAEARFDFVEGPLRGATLDILGNIGVIYTNGSDQVIDANTFEPYEPTDVRLTTGDGRIFDLDIAAGVTRVEDLNGNTLDVTPGGITHSGGDGIAFDRDTEGRVIRITDPAGATIDYTYDARGDLISVQDQVAGVSRFGYDGDHRLLDIEDPRGVKAVRNEYDAEGRLIAVVDANGNRTELNHDLDARREIVSDRRGNVTISVYNEDGNVTSRTDASGGTKTFTYDARGNKLSETSATGQTATFTYDADGNVLTDTSETGAIRSYTYNALGQALTISDPGGATTTSTYDGRGNLLTSTDPLGGVQDQQYDSRGNLTSATDVLGNIRTSVYDGSGRLLEETDPLNATTTYTYDSNGNQLTRTTSRTDASGAVVTMIETSVYDARNRKIHDIDPLGGVEETEYGPAGRVVAKVDRNGNRVAFTYDVQGHRVRTDYSDGTLETATYDAEGNRNTTTDRAGRITTFAYDALNRLISTIFADGSSERREYDAGGHLTAIVDERGNRTAFEYDGSGRRTRTIDALGNATTTVYDTGGNVTSITDALGQTRTYEYDAGGRQIRQVGADGTTVTFAYAARGRKVAETDQGGATTRFEYDALARLTVVIDPLGGRTEYAYDEVGNLVRQTDANGNETTWEYDDAGRPIRKTVPSGVSESFS